MFWLFIILVFGLGVVEGKSVEGKIIGNDQSSINARGREMVQRVRKGRKNAIAGILEQNGQRLEHCPHSVEGIIFSDISMRL